MTKLNRLDAIPDELLTTTSVDLLRVLGGPTLFKLQGDRDPPLFVTVIQHGNEPTGFQAVQQILKKYQSARLPRSMWLFIANVEAAAEGVRTLSHQRDFNRSWPRTETTQSPEAKLMADVVETVTAGPLFASIDLHNNTGANPHYGCVNVLEPEYLHLATLFSRIVVYFRQPVGVQSLAMADHCPAVTLECGQAGENAALDHAVEFLEACLHLHHLPTQPVSSHDITLLQTVAVAKIKPDISFGFAAEEGPQLLFRADLDKLNFSELAAATKLAHVREGVEMPIVITSDDGQNIVDQVLQLENGNLTVRDSLIPSMATLDKGVIRQDCLFYVMREFALKPAA